jgi:hypothetical protein
MARIYILSHLPDYAHLYRSAFYPPPPYLLIDALGLLLAKVLSIVATGKVIFTFQILSVPIAITTLSRLFHRKESPWEFCGYVIAYNSITGFGFANFMISIALAALLIAGIDRVRTSLVKVFLAAGFGIAIVVLTHLTGLLIFFFLFVAHLVNRALHQEETKKTLAIQFLVTLAASIPSLLYYKKITSFYKGYSTEFSPFPYKLSIIPNVLNFDAGVFWKFWLITLVVVFIARIARRDLVSNPVLLGTSLFSLIVFFASPTASMSGSNIDVRLFLFAVMILVAVFTSENRRFLTLFGVIVASQVAYLGIQSISARKQYSEIDTALTNVHSGDIFFTLAGYDVHGLRTMSFEPTIMNYPILELACRNVYDFSVFAIPWQQPMLFQEGILKEMPLIKPIGNTEDISLNMKVIQGMAEASKYGYRQNHQAWLFLTKQPETKVKSDIGTMVTSSDRWILYRIDPPTTP